MSFADDLWLGASATQQSYRHVLNFGAAFYGNAAIQAWKFGIEAPLAFWQAMARASGAPGQAAIPIEAVADVAPAPAALDGIRPDIAPDTAINPVLLDAPRAGKPDDLTSLSGVGEKLAATLNEFGIFHFDQLAGLNEAGIAWLNEQQPGFKALAKRFDIVGQAGKAAE